MAHISRTRKLGRAALILEVFLQADLLFLYCTSGLSKQEWTRYSILALAIFLALLVLLFIRNFIFSKIG